MQIMNSCHLAVSHLKPALVGLGKVMRKRATLPVLGHVRVNFKEPNQLELTCTDLNAWLTFSMPSAGPAAHSDMLIPFLELCSIVKACTSDDILEISPGEGNTLILKSQIGGQRVEHRLESLPLSEFPEVPQFSDSAISLPAGVPSALMVAQECASADATRYVLNGAFLDVSSEEGHYIVGTDGRHLVSSNSFQLPIPRSLIIPNHKFLEWKGFLADGDWKLNLQPAAPTMGGMFQISSSQWRFICREIDGPYPQWKHVLPDPDSYKSQVEFAPEMLDTVAQVVNRLPCHSEQRHTLGLEIRQRRVQLLSRSRVGIPWTKVEVPTEKISGLPVIIFLNRELLLKAFRFGLCRISVIDGISPLLLTNSDRSRQMIVMPLRPDGEDIPSPEEDAPPDDSTSTICETSPQEASASSETTTSTTNSNTMPTYELQPTTTTIIKAATPEPIAAIAAPVPEKPALEAALDQIENIKSGFREGITHLSKLGEMLRQSIREQRTTHREFQAVRQTLRSLQNVRI